MTQKNISLERIKKQRAMLEKLYEGFFCELSRSNFDGNIVLSFPFWEIRGKYFYAEEIYAILKKYCHIQAVFPKSIDLFASKEGSLLYKRKDQLVGREIFKLKSR